MPKMLSEDMKWMRDHPLVTGLIILFVIVSAWLFWGATSSTDQAYDRMAASRHTALDEPSQVLEADDAERQIKERRKAYVRYDASQDRVILPPSREERLATDSSLSEQEWADRQSEYEGRTCQDAPLDAEYSDLCAQWASVSATRYGNRIGAENYRVSSFAAIVSGLALIATVLAVAIAALAARDASKAVKLMKEGMVPFLTVRPGGISGVGKMKLINAGTGVATGAFVKVGNAELPLRRRVLQAGEEFQITHSAIAATNGELQVVLRYNDGSGEAIERRERFRHASGKWVQID